MAIAGYGVPAKRGVLIVAYATIPATVTINPPSISENPLSAINAKTVFIIFQPPCRRIFNGGKTK
jgi:hypothetical protein